MSSSFNSRAIKTSKHFDTENFELCHLFHLSVMQCYSLPTPKTNPPQWRSDNSYKLVYYDICQCFRSACGCMSAFVHVCICFFYTHSDFPSLSFFIIFVLFSAFHQSTHMYRSWFETYKNIQYTRVFVCYFKTSLRDCGV